MLSDITTVEILPEYRLRLSFKTGDVGEIRISDILGPNFDGIFSPLKDPSYFAQVSVNADIGTIVWPNGADIDPRLLYKHAIQNTAITT